MTLWRPCWCTKRLNSGRIGVKNLLGVNLFSLAKKLPRPFLLFQEMCIAAEHMSQEPKRQTRRASMSVYERSDNVTSEGQKNKSLLPREDSNPWPFDHRVGALSTYRDSSSLKISTFFLKQQLVSEMATCF